MSLREVGGSNDSLLFYAASIDMRVRASVHEAVLLACRWEAMQQLTNKRLRLGAARPRSRGAHAVAACCSVVLFAASSVMHSLIQSFIQDNCQTVIIDCWH